MALMTLIGEVIYYKKQHRVQSLLTKTTHTSRQIQQVFLDNYSLKTTHFRGKIVKNHHDISNVQRQLNIMNVDIYSKDESKIQFIT